MKKQFFIYSLIASLMLATFSCFAAEPTNLFFTIKNLERYYHSGAYDKDIAEVNRAALRYLKNRIAKANFKGKPAIVLDIDETCISNYPEMEKHRFGGSPEQIHAYIEKGRGPVIPSTLTLYQYAKAHNVAVIFITGRKEESRADTEETLKSAGYSNWDKLILRSNDHQNTSAATYKTEMRKALTREGYDIILNIGDQKSDLVGGYADKTYKLPNPYYLMN